MGGKEDGGNMTTTLTTLTTLTIRTTPMTPPMILTLIPIPRRARRWTMVDDIDREGRLVKGLRACPTLDLIGARATRIEAGGCWKIDIEERGKEGMVAERESGLV